MKFDNFVNKLSGFKDFLIKESDKILLKETDYIANLNRERLYNEGRGADEVTLGKYRPFTVFMKKKNLPGHDSRTKNITLKDTGSFYEGITITEKSLNTFEIKSTSDTAIKVNAKPQFRDALGLTKKEANVISTIIAEELKTEILNYFK